MKKQTVTDPLAPNFWPSGNSLRFVNAEQFDKNELLDKLGWRGIGSDTTTDADQIRTRQDGLKLLISSKMLSRFLKKNRIDGHAYLSKNFFEKFGPKSTFNKKARGLIEVLERSVDSPDFNSSTQVYQDLVKKLKGEYETVSTVEDNLVKKLKLELKNIFSYSGTVKITSNLEGDSASKTEEDGYGFQDYAFYSDEPKFIELCRKFNSFYRVSAPNLSVLFGLRIAQVLLLPLLVLTVPVTSYADKTRNDALYTRDIPSSVRSEINRIHHQFLNIVNNQLKQRMAKISFGQEVGRYVSVMTEFQFSLTPESQFVIRLIDIDSKIGVPKDEELSSMSEANGGTPFDYSGSYFFKGTSLYSVIKKWFFKKQERKLRNDAARKFIRMPLKHAIEGALATSRDLLLMGKETIRPSAYTAMLDEVKYSKIEDAVSGLGLIDDWLRIKLFHSEVSDLMDSLRSIASKAEVIVATREKLADLPFCFPEVVGDEKNIVSFDNLMPLHLIGRPNKSNTANLGKEDLRAITGLPSLNGQIISITGQNGGGKTVIETELIHTLHLAHMGFPVFADHFVFNAKDVIAMVFIEKGQGSTLQLTMQKLKVVAEEIKTNPNNKVVVVIDELLTGTQEADGYDIGLKYLQMLNKKKCSVMFVTQITQLAEYAKNDLGALCFYFEKDGTMKPGIGRGNAMHLAEEVGLSEYL